MQGQKVVRLLFRLRTGSARLLEDMERYKLIKDDRCVMCESGAGEGVKHVLVMWGI